MSRYINAVSVSLVTYRKQRNFVQKQMADKLSISREHYSRLEEGKAHPSRKLFHRICNLTGDQISLPSGCKSASELEMCYLCAQLKESDADAFRIELMKLLKSYNKVQPLILSFIFQLFFNFDFCSNIFLN